MSTKKSYREVKDNPALSYITQIQDKSESQHDDTVDLVETSTISENVPLQNVLTQAATVEVAPTPEGFRIKPQYRAKSRAVGYNSFFLLRFSARFKQGLSQLTFL